MNLKWRKTDSSMVLVNCPEHAQLELFYARTYTPGAGYKYSETNDLINNLKRPVDRPEAQLAYKRQSIDRFSLELITFLNGALKPGNKIFLVPTPPSKTKANQEYDDRIEQVAIKVAATICNVILFPRITGTLDLEAVHETNTSRTKKIILESLSIEESLVARYEKGGVIAILDDIFTSGAHYSAMRERLLQAFPDARIVGFFWARSEDRRRPL